MNNEMFQNIFNKLQEFLPEKWSKVVLYIGYTAGSYTMKYYTADSKGVYTDCFSQKGVNKADLIKLFMELDKICKKERMDLVDKNRWTVLSMVVDSDGNMKTDFDYADISENAITYEQGWKEKYLK